MVDFHPPGMNGIELLGKLEERHLHYPVILITTGSAREVPECTPYAGIHGVLEKPLEDDALLNGIHAALAYPIAPSVRTAATGSARW